MFNVAICLMCMCINMNLVNYDFIISIFYRNQSNTDRVFIFLILFLVWDSIMDGHPMMQSNKQQTTKTPIRQPTGLFERNPLFDGMDDDNEKPSKTQQSADEHDALPNGYEDDGNHLPFATNIDYQYDLPAVNSPSSNYLIGPMVVRVRPDGTPVDEDKTKPLPIDDDQMTVGTGYFPLSSRLQAPSTRLATPMRSTPNTSH